MKAQDRLPAHLDCHMKSLIDLLKLYFSYAQLEVRTGNAEELVPKRAFDNKRLLDTQALHEEIEALVYEDADEETPKQ